MKTEAFRQNVPPRTRGEADQRHAYRWDVLTPSHGAILLTDRRWLFWLMALYAVLYVAFYPLIYTSVDEASTFRMAFLLRHGAFMPHDPDFFPSISPLGLHGRTYRFPIGFPALLSLLAFGSGKAFFLVNPLAHLVATWFFARLLFALRVSPRYAVLYLLYPSTVLFTRTILSDSFAASLTTIALFCLLRRRTTPWASLLIGAALLTRSASVVLAGAVFVALLIGDLRSHRESSLWRGRAIPFGLGLLPFFAVSGLYNWYTMGNVLKTGYSADQLSLSGLWLAGPLYLSSLLLIYPGMLFAPVLYRGRLWRIGLLTTSIVVLLASAYNESTYGNNPLETLLSTPRQVLPIMPLYLLAYCSVLSAWRRRFRWPRVSLLAPVAGLLFIMALVISILHQKHLNTLQSVRMELQQTLPVGSFVYASKDAFKLHQPVWDSRVYRELPFVSDAQARADVARGSVYAVLYTRSRGFRAEDDNNALIEKDLLSRYRFVPGPSSRTGLLRYYHVLAVQTPASHLKGVSTGR